MPGDDYKRLIEQAYKCRNLAAQTTDRVTAIELEKLANEYAEEANRLLAENEQGAQSPTDK